MHYTATQAKNRFGHLCQQAKLGPVVVEKAGQPDTVLLSYAEYQRLTTPGPATAQRQRFAEQHADWIAAHNEMAEAGMWNDDVKVW